MTRTQYYTGSSIDGFIADADNSLDWLMQFPSSLSRDAHFAAFLDNVGSMVMGATTYEWVVEHEQVLDQPEKWGQWYGSRPCVVMTHHEVPVVPGSDVAFLQGDLGDIHSRLVAAARGRNVWLVGGGELVGQFADRGLLDEVIVSVAPVFLGAGAPLLPRRIISGLRLTDVQRADQFALLTYTVERPVPAF